MTRISLFRLSLRNRFSRALVLYLGFILEDLRFKKLLAALAGQKVCVLVKSWRWVCCAAGVESPPPPPPASDSLSQTPSPRTHHGERKTPIKTRRFSVSSIWHKIYFFCLLRLLTNHAVQKTSLAGVCEEGPGFCAHLLTLISVVIILVTLPFSLCCVVQVSVAVVPIFSDALCISCDLTFVHNMSVGERTATKDLRVSAVMYQLACRWCRSTSAPSSSGWAASCPAGRADPASSSSSPAWISTRKLPFGFETSMFPLRRFAADFLFI